MLSPGDSDLVRREPALPGLSVVLDPDALVAAIRPYLPEPPDWTECTHVRYKPGTSCLAAYRLSVAQAETHLYARAYPHTASNKLGKGRPPEAAHGRAPLLLDDLGILVSFFPEDRRLRALARINQPDYRCRRLARFFPARPELCSGLLHLLRYKPERRYVAALYADKQPAAVLRLYDKSDYQAARAGSRRLSSGDVLRLARPLGYCDRDRMALWAWLPGRALGDLVLLEEFEPANMAAVGVALAELHAQHNARARTLAREMEAAAFYEVAAGLESLCPHLADSAGRLAQRLGERIVQFDRMDRSLHGDFYASQVLIDGPRVGIVDLDSTVRGDPALDLGNFIAHLHLAALRGDLPLRRAEALAEGLCTGYQSVGDPGVLERVSTYCAAGLLRASPHFFRSRDPVWPERIEAALGRAETMLHGDDGRRYRAARARPRRSPRQAQPVRVCDPFGAAGDPRMGFLAKALDPREAIGGLRSLTQWPEPSASSIALREIRVTRYKPGRRCLVEYDLQIEDATGGDRFVTLLGKARAKGLDSFSHSIAERLWSNGFDEHAPDGVCIPRPLGCVPSWHMVFQQKAGGIAATGLLAGPDGVALAGRIADGIVKLHRMNLPLERRHTMDDELRILHERLSTLAETRPDWSQRLRRVLEACRRLGAAVAEPAPRLIHRDFYPDQVLVDGPRLYLLDLDLCCEGDPALDLGNFCGHLQEQSLRLRGRPDAMLDVQSAFEERYVESAGPQVRSALRAYTTLTLVRHIHLSTLFPQRQAFSGQLLELCEEHLGL